MKDKIIFKNTNIANYVMFMLDKIDNEFTSEELEKITELTIDYDEDNNIILEELFVFKNLESLYLRNGFIDNTYLTFLLCFEKLNSIYFDKCEFENADLIALLKLKELSLINCKINNYSFIMVLTELEHLSIVNGKIEISKINKLKRLKYLQLSYSNILDNIGLDLENLRELYIDNSNIETLEVIKKLVNLKKISIDEKQYYNNKKIIGDLLNNGIEVYNDGIIEFNEAYNED